MTSYLDIDELAELMGLSPGTVMRKLSLSPAAIPPKMHLPASKMLRWRSDEVTIWMFETGWSRPVHRGAALHPSSQKREKRL